MVFTAHVLRHSLYTAMVSSLTAMMAALAITLETYRSFPSYSKLWNKNNFFVWFKKTFPTKLTLSKGTKTFLYSATLSLFCFWLKFLSGSTL